MNNDSLRGFHSTPMNNRIAIKFKKGACHVSQNVNCGVYHYRYQFVG